MDKKINSFIFENKIGQLLQTYLLLGVHAAFQPQLQNQTLSRKKSNNITLNFYFNYICYMMKYLKYNENVEDTDNHLCNCSYIL